MKNRIKTLFIATLLSISITSFAQIKNTVSLNETEILTTKNSTDFIVETDVEGVQYFTFSKEDKGDLNQYLEATPMNIIKTIKIDSDSNDTFDKEITLLFNKEQLQELKYETVRDGIIFRDQSNQAKYIKNEGLYQIDTKEIDNVIVMVDDLSK